MNYICNPCIELSVVLKKDPKAELYHTGFCSKASPSHYFNPRTSTHESPEPFYVATSCINILSKVTLSLAFQGSPWKCQGLPRLDWGILVERQLGHQLKDFSSDSAMKKHITHQKLTLAGCHYRITMLICQKEETKAVIFDILHSRTGPEWQHSPCICHLILEISQYIWYSL